jgi:hypothetical protein
MRIERALRILMLTLAGFDLVLGTILLFFGGALFTLANVAPYAEPRFFMACVGLFLYQYVYVQYVGFRSPAKSPTALTLTLVVRVCFALAYLGTALIAWAGTWTLVHTLFCVSAAVDLGAAVFIVIAMKKLGLGWFQADQTATDDKGPRPLRLVLLVLAISEFLIAWNWLLVPGFWLRFFAVPYFVDPFWTRATGIFLLNIALIQGLGAWSASRYWTAAVTSGIFRALWPLLYWYWVATGTGNTLFKASILFFSFFDTAACIFIFLQLRRVRRAS